MKHPAQAPQTILLVADETSTAHSHRNIFYPSEFTLLWAENEHDALITAQQKCPDVIVIDLQADLIEHWWLSERLREITSAPLLMLTDRLTDEMIRIGMKLRAVDYLVEPFSPEEFIIRVSLMLRRAVGYSENRDQLVAGPLRLNLDMKQAYINEKLIILSPSQFELLEFFVRHPNKIFSRQEIIERLQDYQFRGTERAIDVHISRLRARISSNEATKQMLQTIFGQGYRLSVDQI